MPEGRLLIDSDVFVTLAGSDLLFRTLELLGFTPVQARRLDPLPHMLAKRPMVNVYSTDVRQRAQIACGQVQGLREKPKNRSVESRLLEVADIGEALLYAIATESPNALLASGDKAAMRAICSDPALQDVHDAVAGRVICFETLMRMLVHADGVGAVAAGFRAITHHKTIQVVFSEVNSRDQIQCLAAIDSYLRELRGWVGDEFLCEP
jgi:hypothetical protein